MFGWMNGCYLILHSFQQYCSHVRVKVGDNEKLHAIESYLVKRISSSSGH